MAGMHSTGGGLSDRSWEILIRRIKNGDCTPFLGAGAAAHVLDDAKKLANRWAEEYDYPFVDADNLARVAQFLVAKTDSMFPKEAFSEQIKNVSPPDFSAKNEPHALMAELNLPIYITTNYDNFMAEALRYKNKSCEVDFLRWCKQLENHHKSSILKTEYVPASDHPLVYHMHGVSDIPGSMVLTECDYIDFMINYARKPDFLPPAILAALSSSALLFVGYSLSDINFRILFRSIISSMEADLDYTSVAVQLDPSNVREGQIEKAREYLDEYFDKQFKVDIDVYWGKASDFLEELTSRWTNSQVGQNNG